MKDYSVSLPVVVSGGDETCSRVFEHSLVLQVSARNKKDAIKRLTDQLNASLAKPKTKTKKPKTKGD